MTNSNDEVRGHIARVNKNLAYPDAIRETIANIDEALYLESQLLRDAWDVCANEVGEAMQAGLRDLAARAARMDALIGEGRTARRLYQAVYGDRAAESLDARPVDDDV